MSIASIRITPALSLILPGSYHGYRGRYGSGICWAIAVLALMPTILLGLIALLLCYLSAVKLSKTWSFPQDSLWSALNHLPMPNRQWLHAHQSWEKITVADRDKNERPMLPAQRERILEIADEMEPKNLDSLGERQAAMLISQLALRQGNISKPLLTQFFLEQGYRVSDSLVQEICNHYSLTSEERNSREDNEIFAELRDGFS